MVAKPSPPEICWHLMAPFTPLGPGYAGSTDSAVGCSFVDVGHCTRNDWALAATVAKQARNTDSQTWYGLLENMKPSSLVCLEQEAMPLSAVLENRLTLSPAGLPDPSRGRTPAPVCARRRTGSPWGNDCRRTETKADVCPNYSSRGRRRSSRLEPDRLAIQQPLSASTGG